MKIEFDIFNREFFRILPFYLKFQKKAQVSIIYMKNIMFLLPSCTTGTRKCYVVRILYAISFQWSKCVGYRGQQIGPSRTPDQWSSMAIGNMNKIKRNSIVN